MVTYSHKSKDSCFYAFIKVIFFLYLLFFIYVVFTEVPFLDISGNFFEFQVIPFKTILEYFTVEVPDYISQDMIPHLQGIFIVHTIGNILLFVPMGLLLPILCFSKSKKKFSIIEIGIIICSKELLQLLIVLVSCFTLNFKYAGIIDIDDIILNGIGFTVGYIFYKAFKRYTDAIKSKEK